MGWGDFAGFLGKVGDRMVQGKKEALRNKITKYKGEMDALINKGNMDGKSRLYYAKLAGLLKEAEEQLKNI